MEIQSRSQIAVLSLSLFCTSLFSNTGVADVLDLHLTSRAVVQLNQNVTLKGSIHSDGSFTGKIALSVDASALRSASSDITVNITPVVLEVSSSTGQTDFPFEVSFTTTAGSHSFAALEVPVIAKRDGAATVLSKTVLFTVNPIYEIDLTGGTIPEGWSSPQSVVMPKHDPAVILRFVNLDRSSTHTIHGEGAILHQDTDTPLEKPTASYPGGVYQITVPAGDPVMGYYRCHDHETENMLRSISFNN